MLTGEEISRTTEICLDFVLQNLSVPLEPCLCLFHHRTLCTDNIPKIRRVVRFYEVGEFVNDDVVNYEYRRLDETPVESDRAFDGARAPAVTTIDNLCGCVLHAKLTG